MQQGRYLLSHAPSFTLVTVVLNVPPGAPAVCGSSFMKQRSDPHPSKLKLFELDKVQFIKFTFDRFEFWFPASHPPPPPLLFVVVVVVAYL